MPARTTRPRAHPVARAPCESVSFLPSSLDLEGVLGTPLQAHPLAPGLERLLRGRLEVLPDDGELAPGVELDDVTREHADVDDVADPAGLAIPSWGVTIGVVHLDLLRAH